MQSSVDSSMWSSEEEAKDSRKAWDRTPEDRAFAGHRPQDYIVKPPSGLAVMASLVQIAQVRGISLMEPTALDSGSLHVLPPESEFQTPVEILGQIGLILTDLSVSQVRDLVDKGYHVFKNEVRYIPPVDPEAFAKFMASGGQWSDAGEFTWGLQAIGVPRTAFSGRGIKVAVLDTGCDPSHPDFVNRIKLENVISFVVGETPSDRHGHGTHVCGTIAGPRQPQSGPRYGVAPDCELLVCKVLSNSGSGYDSWILKGINWAASRGATVINMSLGSKRQAGDEPGVQYEGLARTLLENPEPSLLIAAAGNDSARPAYVAPVGTPAACESIMAVAAIDSSATVAGFSCGDVDGFVVDLAGPGVDILSTAFGGGSSFKNGTSMACPHVAGAAVLWAESDATLRGMPLRSKLLASARRLNEAAAAVGAGLVQTP